jgi:putative membrane protein
LSWWSVSGHRGDKAPVFVLGRLMREAASDVLPFSQLGGIVVSTRVAVLGGVSAGTAIGACVVDITLEIVAQLTYTLFGVALLAQHLGFASQNHGLLLAILAGVLAIACVVAALIATRKRGLGLAKRLVERVAPAAAQHAVAVTTAIEAAYGRPPRLWLCLMLHILAWFGAAGGTWLILALIGHPLPFLSVVAIESLLFAIRNVAFIIPGGWGVQEGVYALIGPLFGLPAEAALALSLIKRARDIAIGVPLLVVWQVMESRVRLRGKSTQSA